MGYACNREIEVKEATREQLEDRIREALHTLNLSLMTVGPINRGYIDAAICTLETGFPF